MTYTKFLSETFKKNNQIRFIKNEYGIIGVENIQTGDKYITLSKTIKGLGFKKKDK